MSWRGPHQLHERSRVAVVPDSERTPTAIGLTDELKVNQRDQVGVVQDVGQGMSDDVGLQQRLCLDFLREKKL